MSAESVVSVFEGFRMTPTAIDQYEQGGREKLISKLASFVEHNKTIEFVMLGYPFKSTNHRDKTIGVLPDLAEEVSVKNFGAFSEQVSQVYPAGVHFHIVSDGFIFNDLLEETCSVVEAYNEAVRAMAEGSNITLLGLGDFYCGPLSGARDKAMAQFGISDVELENRILFDPNVNALYRGMIHFMEEELAYRSYSSHNKLHKAAKLLARKMMFRNEAYSHLVEAEFPQNIRLSMHPSTNNGAKYSFRLIPGEHSWTAPWHCALLVERSGGYATIHRKDAEAAGYRLVTREGRPYFYEEV